MLNKKENILIGTFSIYNEIDIFVFQIETLLSFCDKIVVLLDNSQEDLVNMAKTYESDIVHIIHIKKTDNIRERDERGDRERLLKKAIELGATHCFHTDADEIVAIKSLNKLRDITENLDDTVYKFVRVDFWESGFLYRIPYNTNENAKKVIPSYPPPVRMDYIFPVNEKTTYGSRSVPNYHCERLPSNTPATKAVLIEDIFVMHYGYYTKNLVDKKNKFYNPGFVSNAHWSEDMQASKEEFIEKWGMGYFPRK